MGNVLEEKKNTMTNTRRKTNTKLTEMKKYCLELDELPLDHNDPSKPSHRLTNGPEPSKTIESDGSNIKKPS